MSQRREREVSCWRAAVGRQVRLFGEGEGEGEGEESLGGGCWD